MAARPQTYSVHTGQVTDLLRRCTCHTDRRNSRRCSRSRRSRTSSCYRHHRRSHSRSRIQYRRIRQKSRRSCCRSRSRRKSHSCYCSYTCLNRCEQEGHAKATRVTRLYRQDIGKIGLSRGRQTNQLPEQPEASCRRAGPPSTSPKITESCGPPSTSPKITESCGESCPLSSDGSTQLLAVESITARWTSIVYRGLCICFVVCELG